MADEKPAEKNDPPQEPQPSGSKDDEDQPKSRESPSVSTIFKKEDKQTEEAGPAKPESKWIDSYNKFLYERQLNILHEKLLPDPYLARSSSSTIEIDEEPSIPELATVESADTIDHIEVVAVSPTLRPSTAVTNLTVTPNNSPIRTGAPDAEQPGTSSGFHHLAPLEVIQLLPPVGMGEGRQVRPCISYDFALHPGRADSPRWIGLGAVCHGDLCRRPAMTDLTSLTEPPSDENPVAIVNPSSRIDLNPPLEEAMTEESSHDDEAGPQAAE